MVGVISLILILTLSLLINKIGSVILVQTGLSQEAAKFQARSALTSTGFTTRESERITQHPVRRRVVMTLMLIGNAGLVTVMASLLLAFIDRTEQSFPWYYNIAILCGGIIIIWVLSTRQVFDRWLNAVIEHHLRRYASMLQRDYRALHRLSGDYQISELYVGRHQWVTGKKLTQSMLKLAKVTLLGIERRDGSYLGFIDDEVSIEKGDKLILYGRGEDIQRFDSDRVSP